MKYLFLIVLLAVYGILGRSEAAAGPGDDPARKIPPIRISIASSYQEWAQDGNRLHELSIPVAAQIQLQPNLGVRLGISQASAQGDGFEQVSGITDMHAALEYRMQIRSVQVIGNLSLALPTGTVQLSDDAFRTAFQLGLRQYDFSVPHFGQGTSIAPRLAVIIPATDDLVVSIGASYRKRGSFEPVSDLVDTYDWGDEYLVDVGAEWHATRTITVSADVLVVHYDADKIGEATVYDAGDRRVLQAQIHKQMRRNDLWLTFQYHDTAANQARISGVLQPEVVATFAGMIRAAGYYRVQLTPTVRATVHAEATQYEADATFDQLRLIDLGLAPEIALSPAVNIPLQFSYTLGDLEGFKASVGLNVIF